MGKTTQKRTCQKWRSRLDRYASGGRLPRGTRVKETGGYVLRPLSTASQNERVGMTRSFTGRSGTCARKWGAQIWKAFRRPRKQKKFARWRERRKSTAFSSPDSSVWCGARLAPVSLVARRGSVDRVFRFRRQLRNRVAHARGFGTCATGVVLWWSDGSTCQQRGSPREGGVPRHGVPGLHPLCLRTERLLRHQRGLRDSTGGA